MQWSLAYKVITHTSRRGEYNFLPVSHHVSPKIISGRIDLFMYFPHLDCSRIPFYLGLWNIFKGHWEYNSIYTYRGITYKLLYCQWRFVLKFFKWPKFFHSSFWIYYQYFWFYIYKTQSPSCYFDNNVNQWRWCRYYLGEWLVFVDWY